MNQGKAYEDLRDLTQNIGHRLSGTKAYDKSVIWAQNKLIEAGADSVWLEEVMVPHWFRGKESLKIKSKNGDWQSINMLSIGNSEGTKGKNLEAEIILVTSIDEFEKLNPADVKGKFVFFNYEFKQEIYNTFFAYSDAGKYRWTTAELVAKKGGVGVIIRSISSAFDDVPHTGSFRRTEQTVPAVAIGTSTADSLAETLKKQKVFAQLNSECTMLPYKKSYSVIGEIRGKKDQSVIVVSGHLDSWDVGEGAHDDGAGIVQSIEVLRAFKNLKIPNQHTIRVVCYANEENGLKGGLKYAENVKNRNEKHILAIESDAGGFSPRGFGLEMEEPQRKQIQAWAPLFLPYGVYDFSLEHGGADIGPLKDLGVPLAGLYPDSQRYFDLHHTAEDTFDKVNRRELLLGAVAMAQLVYLVDLYW